MITLLGLLCACSAHNKPPLTAADELRASPAVSRCDTVEVDRSPPTRDRVPFGLYSAAIADFDDLARSGFTLVGPWYDDETLSSRLDAAHAAGLGVIVPVGYDHRRYLEARSITWTETQTNMEITARIASLAEHPAIFAWYLLPEELRSWSNAELRYLAWATAAIRAADPEQRPILSYQPNARGTAGLVPIATELDIVAKGAYVNYAGHIDERAWVRYSVGQSVEAAAAVDRHSAVWAVPEMFADADGRKDEIEAWTRHDVYASLVSGATGVLVYSGFRRQGFSTYDAYRAGYERVARELNGEDGLGAALVFATKCTGPRVVAEERGATFHTDGREVSVPAVAWRTTAHGDHWYMLIVNSGAEPADVTIEEAEAFEIVSGPVRSTPTQSQLQLPPLAVVVLRGRRA